MEMPHLSHETKLSWGNFFMMVPGPHSGHVLLVQTYTAPSLLVVQLQLVRQLVQDGRDGRLRRRVLVRGADADSPVRFGRFPFVLSVVRQFPHFLRRFFFPFWACWPTYRVHVRLDALFKLLQLDAGIDATNGFFHFVNLLGQGTFGANETPFVPHAGQAGLHEGQLLLQLRQQVILLFHNFLSLLGNDGIERLIGRPPSSCSESWRGLFFCPRICLSTRCVAFYSFCCHRNKKDDGKRTRCDSSSVEIRADYSLKNVMQVTLQFRSSDVRPLKGRRQNLVFSMERALPKLIAKVAKKDKVEYEETLSIESQELFVTTSKQTIPLVNCDIDSKISYTGDEKKTVCFGTVKFELGKMGCNDQEAIDRPVFENV